MASRSDMGLRSARGDFLPPPIPPRREPLPPMPSIGLRGPSSSSLTSSSIRDPSFSSRTTSDYSMFSRRSPPVSSASVASSRRLYEDFSRDTFDERRWVGVRNANYFCSCCWFCVFITGRGLEDRRLLEDMPRTEFPAGSVNFTFKRVLDQCFIGFIVCLISFSFLH